VVQAGDNLTVIAKKLGYADPMALARANHLQDPDRLQIGQVLTLPEHHGPAPQNSGRTRLARPEGKPAVEQSQAAAAEKPSSERRLVVASWYGSQHHGKLMANGEPFDMFANTAAHKKLPLGTQLTITNPKNGAKVEVEVTDRGPYIPGRNLDLSFGAARKLGIVKTGVAKVWMEDG
jgi:rare lipoprotein A